MLATLYREKSDKENTRKCYLEALKESKLHSFKREYHILLRKADICYEIPESIPIIKKSKDYFKNVRDIKEYAKAVHNLGADCLFEEKWEEAFEYLRQGEKAFDSFGSIDVLYSYIGLGIYEAIHNADYKSALEYFKMADYKEMNAFKQLTIWLNQAMCYQKARR